jgi:hypothetical protein
LLKNDKSLEQEANMEDGNTKGKSTDVAYTQSEAKHMKVQYDDWAAS